MNCQEMVSSTRVPQTEIRAKKPVTDWFEVVEATTAERLDQVFRLRYKIYCQENKFESPDDHPTCREIDVFDDRSIHALVVDRETFDPIGTVRLILADPQSPENSFPIQRICNHRLLANRRVLLQDGAAEISRFAISRDFRKKKRDHLQQAATAENSGDILAWLILGLLRGVVKMSMENNVSELFAVMEPSLIRLLARFGIIFKPIGPLVEYHGMRQPCYTNIYAISETVKNNNCHLWDYLTDGGKFFGNNSSRYESMTASGRNRYHYCEPVA